MSSKECVLSKSPTEYHPQVSVTRLSEMKESNCSACCEGFKPASTLVNMSVSRVINILHYYIITSQESVAAVVFS